MPPLPPSLSSSKFHKAESPKNKLRHKLESLNHASSEKKEIKNKPRDKWEIIESINKKLLNDLPLSEEEKQILNKQQN
jgi:hypothetical protein